MRRARLDLMVVSALATLAVLLGVTLTDTSAAATSTASSSRAAFP